jgi:periplasmic divalent cation tolerance protein
METADNAAGGQEICVIFSTVPPGQSAAIAEKLLGSSLVACVNIVPVRSLYRWKGENCNDEEHLLVIKTRRSLADEAIRAIRMVHPYEIPEIIALPVIAGHAPYIGWVYGETGGT